MSDRTGLTVCRQLRAAVLCGAAWLTLSSAAALAQSFSGEHHHESLHNHHTGEFPIGMQTGGVQSGGVQSGGVAIFSAGPTVSGPNYLLGVNPLGLSLPYPPSGMASSFVVTGPLWPSGGLGGFVGGSGGGFANGGFGGNGFAGGVPWNGGLIGNGGQVGNGGLVGNGGQAAGGGGFADPAAPAPAPVRARSNDASRARANHFVSFGDEHFHKQQYNLALERYKDASKSAPDLASPYFRQAFAWAAMSKYDQAAKALRRGLSIDADWPAAAFQLKELYADNRLAKTSHWEAIAKAATEDPQDADLLFLLAVELYCDGQRERSRAFFQRAKSLEPGDLSHIKAFLSRLGGGAAPVAVAPMAAQ